MSDATMALSPAFWDRTLHQVKYSVGVGLATTESMTLTPETSDTLAAGITAQFTCAVLREQLPTEYTDTTAERTVEFPHFATWWDHFKATYRGRWWMRWRRWAVRYRIETQTLRARMTVNVERFASYPHADMALPELGEPVRIMHPKTNWIGWTDHD